MVQFKEIKLGKYFTYKKCNFKKIGSNSARCIYSDTPLYIEDNCYHFFSFMECQIG